MKQFLLCNQHKWFCLLEVLKITLQTKGPNTYVSFYFFFQVDATEPQQILKMHETYYSFTYVLMKFRVCYGCFLLAVLRHKRQLFFSNLINSLQKGWQKVEHGIVIRLHFYFLTTFYLTQTCFPPFYLFLTGVSQVIIQT